jgi:hypothetical protein
LRAYIAREQYYPAMSIFSFADKYCALPHCAFDRKHSITFRSLLIYIQFSILIL